MAVLAVAGVFAAAGAGVGAAAGLTTMGILTAASIGFSVGTMAGNALFPVTTNAQGPRLNDLKVTTSTYGTIIPIGFGTTRVAGNIIWAEELTEHKNTTHVSGGGKGSMMGKGGSATQTTYTYTCSFATALCQGPADAIIRLWANSTLIYDVSEGADTVKRNGLQFRFYPGDETQLPDSLMEADKGIGSVPAHRGLCYLVFEDLDLTDFGNALPNIQAEVSFGAPKQHSYLVMARPTNSKFGQYVPDFITFNPLTLRGYFYGRNPSGVVEFDLDTMQVVSEHTLGEITGDPAKNSSLIDYPYAHLVVGTDQKLYLGFDHTLWKVNPHSWSLDGSVGLISSGGSLFPAYCGRSAPVALMGPNGQENYIAVVDGFTRNQIYIVRGDDASLVDTVFPSLGGGSTGGGAFAITMGQPGAMSGTAYAVSCSLDANLVGPAINIDRITVEVHVDIGLLGYSFKREASTQTVFSLNIADVDPEASGWWSTFVNHFSVFYDDADSGVIVVAPARVGSLTEAWIFKWTPDGGLMWVTKLPGVNATCPSFGGQISGGNVYYGFGGNVITIDASTGAISDIDGWPASVVPFSSNWAQTFSNDLGFLIAAQNTTSTWTRYTLGRRVAVPAQLADIVTTICETASLGADEIDVSSIEDVQVNGFMVSQRGQAAAALTPLLQVYQVDAVEIDYKLVFRARGGAIAATLAQDLLVQSQSSDQPEPYVETRTQEIDLPRIVTVTYSDPEQTYQAATQYAKRVREPRPTVYSDQQLDLQTAVVMTANAARQAAETLMFTAWVGRTSFQGLMPPDLMWLDVSDAVQITLDSGYTARVRISAATYGVDNSIDVTLVAETDGQYLSTATGIESAGVLSQEVVNEQPSALFLLDVPLLRDVDDLTTTGIRGYWAASAYTDVRWPGAQLQGSADQTAWSALGITTEEASWGYLESPLPDALSTFRTLYDQSVVVAMVVGSDTLASVTELQLANGANAAAVFKANGDIEIIQFLNATQVAGSSNRFTLSGLNRGVRGTDTMAASHGAGEQIVMLSTSTVSGLVLPMSALNVAGFYRAVTPRTLPETAQQDVQVFHGRDKMPYAPVSVTATLSGSDVVLSWVRRARVNGSLQDSTGDVPLGESSEAYEVDIYNAAGTAIVRTLSTTAPSATYTSSQIATDLGSLPSTLTVAVYQISAQVGRGFGRIDTIGVH